MKTHSLASLAALSLLLTGCIVFSGGDPPCAEGDLAAEEAPSIEQRDPNSGVCTYIGGGGGGGGGGSCGDWGGDAPGQRAPQLPPEDWATCYQGCEGLDEGTCLATPSCRAAYIDQWGTQSFYECWGTAPSGAIQGGGCEGLDAYQCSRHDDCSAVHGSWEAPGQDGGFQNGIAEFQSCIPEGDQEGCYGDAECGDGSHCNADTLCLPDPSCGGSGGGFEPQVPCDAACYGYCVPDVTPDHGTCTGDVFCESLPPACPADTLPGRLNGCWTGFCIPLDQCEALPDCATLDEAQCVARQECQGIYEGVDCVCDADSCTCADWLFEGCETGFDTTPAGP